MFRMTAHGISSSGSTRALTNQTLLRFTAIPVKSAVQSRQGGRLKRRAGDGQRIRQRKIYGKRRFQMSWYKKKGKKKIFKKKIPGYYARKWKKQFRTVFSKISKYFFLFIIKNKQKNGIVRRKKVELVKRHPPKTADVDMRWRTEQNGGFVQKNLPGRGNKTETEQRTKRFRTISFLERKLKRRSPPKWRRQGCSEPGNRVAPQRHPPVTLALDFLSKEENRIEGYFFFVFK